MKTSKYTIMIFDDEEFGMDNLKELFRKKGCNFIGSLPDAAMENFNDIHDEILDKYK